MGYILGGKLGKVLAVAHRNKKIIDEHLRVRVEHLVEEPLRKTIDTTTVGSKVEILYDVKYEKLPNFCFCCGLLGHTTARFCNIPKELRKPSSPTTSRRRPSGAPCKLRAALVGGTSAWEVAGTTGIFRTTTTQSWSSCRKRKSLPWLRRYRSCRWRPRPHWLRRRKTPLKLVKKTSVYWGQGPSRWGGSR
uniref:Zinc knuckle CX2CX4HX4C domain-containing protein n=1 Tax=Triticum urartu TaxID=4572 RepID=A0A8R7NX13_TRIUA